MSCLEVCMDCALVQTQERSACCFIASTAALCFPLCFVRLLSYGIALAASPTEEACRWLGSQETGVCRQSPAWACVHAGYHVRRQIPVWACMQARFLFGRACMHGRVCMQGRFLCGRACMHVLT